MDEQMLNPKDLSEIKDLQVMLYSIYFQGQLLSL